MTGDAHTNGPACSNSIGKTAAGLLWLWRPFVSVANNKVERLYHQAGWLSYPETVVKVENGERRFCTEPEAITAVGKHQSALTE